MHRSACHTAMARGFLTVAQCSLRGSFDRLCSIVGIGVSLGPALLVLLRPLRAWLLRAWRALLERVIEPVARRLHKWGVFEALAWSILGMTVLDAHRFYGPAAGYYLSLTALALAVPATAYSALLHAAPFKERYAKKRAAATPVEKFATEPPDD